MTVSCDCIGITISAPDTGVDILHYYRCMIKLTDGRCKPGRLPATRLPCDKLALNIAVLVPRIQTIEKSSQEETRNVSSSADTKLD